MKIATTPDNFREIIVKGYSLDLIYVLKLIELKIDISELRESSIKIDGIYQTLIRKDLISEKEELTLIGKDLLTFISSTSATKFVKKKPVDGDFNLWWKTFPGTDTFKCQGVHFQGSRSLRTNKEACRVKFNKIILEGEYTSEQLIGALKFDVNQKVATSVKLNQNKLTFMQNSLTYLNQRSYEPFIELIDKGVEVEVNKPMGGTDI